DLRDVTQIMTKNMEDLLWRGDSLDRMSSLSDRLREDSKTFHKKAWRANLELQIRKYGVPVAIVLGFFLILYLRYKLF
ncbi:SNAP receptor, partial [Kickxella alabastrina]